MNETLIGVLTVSAGFFLGTSFFGSLWWTIRCGLTSKRPALLFFGSFLVRTSIVLAGFYIVSHGRLERLLICLLGFIIGRFIVTRFVGSSGLSLIPPAKEACHAPESR